MENIQPQLPSTIIKQIVLYCVTDDRYLLSFPYIFVNKQWNAIFVKDKYWEKLCRARWTSLSLLPDNYQIKSYFISPSNPTIPNIDNNNNNRIPQSRNAQNENPHGFSIINKDSRSPNYYLYGSTLITPPTPNVFVKSWRELFTRRYNRTGHLRILSTQTSSFEFVKDVDQRFDINKQISLVKSMGAYDEDLLDKYRRNPDKQKDLFILESVEYAILDQTVHHLFKYLNIITDVAGTVMTLNGKRIKFRLFAGIRDSFYSHYAHYPEDHTFIGSSVFPDHRLEDEQEIKKFWRGVKKEIGWTGGLGDLQDLFKVILVPRIDFNWIGNKNIPSS